jgi:putative PIN family toxin of toxin-antitoxin system
MALRIVADTNVYVSIFQFGGRLSEILEVAVAGSVELYISEPILEELRGVLTRKFQWSAERAQLAADTLRRFCRLITPRHSLRVATDPDDDRILECALEARAEVIISGDRDLLALGAFGDMPIMGPGRFLDSAPWKT